MRTITCSRLLLPSLLPDILGPEPARPLDTYVRVPH
jgi:hypothetical protein